MAPLCRDARNPKVMKRQICFAGFAEAELETLQPSLAALGAAWDCVVTPDAAYAFDNDLTRPSIPALAVP